MWLFMDFYVTSFHHSQPRVLNVIDNPPGTETKQGLMGQLHHKPQQLKIVPIKNIINKNRYPNKKNSESLITRKTCKKWGVYLIECSIFMGSTISLRAGTATSPVMPTSKEAWSLRHWNLGDDNDLEMCRVYTAGKWKVGKNV